MKNPIIPEQLLEWLQQLYPSKCPTLDMTDRDIWFYAGSRAVVEKLQNHFDSQQKRLEEVL